MDCADLQKRGWSSWSRNGHIYEAEESRSGVSDGSAGRQGNSLMGNKAGISYKLKGLQKCAAINDLGRARAGLGYEKAVAAALCRHRLLRTTELWRNGVAAISVERAFRTLLRTD
jgi:hypothetical protein